MRIFFIYSFILCLVTFVSCNSGSDKKAAIEHFCNFGKGLSPLIAANNDFAQTALTAARKIAADEYKQNEIPDAFDEIISADDKFVLHIDSVIEDISKVKAIKSETGMQENTLKYLKNLKTFCQGDFKSVCLLMKQSQSNGTSADLDKFKAAFIEVSSYGDSILDLQKKYYEEFKFSDDDQKQINDCSGK